LWASDERDRDRGFAIRVLLRDGDGLTLLEHTLPDESAHYPDLSTIFPVANRMQRAAFDLVGAQCDADDQRPWTWQAAWPIDRFPLQRDFEVSPAWAQGEEDYPFVRVAGDGVHEIAVGPVHAGTIEPGHFRFQVVGEKVLRLEERLGYTHKGIEKRFESLPLLDGYRLAGRISGDSTVAYACAYAQAVESIAQCAAPPRAAWLRALCLERERIASHLGDLGYLGNDGGFAFGHSQFSRLREDVLRLNDRAFGHRLLMDVVMPGGVACELRVEDAALMRDQCHALERELAVLREIYDEHSGLQDRFRTCGRVTRELAMRLGLTGLAARASGLSDDLRCDFAWTPYDTLGVRRATHADGDVAARVAVRFDETFESLRLVGAMLAAMPDGDIATELPEVPASRLAIGCAEGWRGPVFIALESGPEGTIRRCHPHDPSWQNWPVIEHAVIGNIVPDFPLINKSFNLSYSGHDL
jgi:Ni,Fe-hydrogenase III large subunit